MPEKLSDVEFVKFLVQQIVNYPEEVALERTVDERGVFIRVRVNKEDTPFVIGKLGANINAIRTLVRIVGAKNKSRINLRIEEPEGSTHYRQEGDETRRPGRYPVREMVKDI